MGIDWEEMEGLFCQQAPPGSAGSSPRLGRTTNEPQEKKSRKETTEITLLDGKRSLNVNIFLKQFRRYFIIFIKVEMFNKKKKLNIRFAF